MSRLGSEKQQGQFWPLFIILVSVSDCAFYKSDSVDISVPSLFYLFRIDYRQIVLSYG